MAVSIELTENKSEKIAYDHCDYPFYVRRGKLSEYAGFAAADHWHDAIEMIAVTDGEMEYNVNGQISHMSAGDGIIVNSGQMHFGFSSQMNECEFICVILHPVVLCPVHAFERDFIGPFISDPQIPFILLHPGHLWQKEICGRIISIYESRRRRSAPLRTLSDFAAIWAILCENVPSNTHLRQRPDRGLSVVKDMVSFIQKNYTKKISLSDIAGAGSVGKSKCHKLFNRFFALSPNAYLTQYRLNKSIELLQTTDLPVIEIALSTGFGGASYYSETFRKWMKKSPSEFRKDSGHSI